MFHLPRRRDEAILLGRCWINKKNEIKRGISNAETCEKLLEELYRDNPAGVKDFRCEITTPDGKVIAEKPYKIPQAYEDQIRSTRFHIK
ncbi:hypothetical protein TNIN_480991 [Trichonephila inaurata madagascariensis]|uniref:Uncharacterized protein n=1 Tax=Trichonephila inaurata madagascariensis TaxID=2747483 RepID=A0A8X6JS97_9ARAC|nr:hypothetical protein TNIN_480991 [Trichonephila inaurata madagascariensis]